MKRHKIGERILSPRKPQFTDSLCTVESILLCETLDSFSKNYLKGAMTFKFIGCDNTKIKISSKYFLYTLKYMLFNSNPDSVLNLTAFEENGELYISIENYSEINDENIICEIAELSKQSGFKFIKKDGIIILKTEIINSAELSIYAKDKEYTSDLFYKILFG